MRLNKIRCSVLLLLFVFSGSLPASTTNVRGDVTDDAAGPAARTVAPLELIDDRGRGVRLNHFANRIVSLSPNITELVFSAGAGSKLVGASRYSDYPEEAKTVQEIGDASGLDFERILALKPDLVIAWRSGNSAADIGKLEKLGLPVFAAEAVRLEDIPRLLRATGKLAGTSWLAESAARAYEEELQQIKHRYDTHHKISVFHLIWDQPLMTTNANHMASDIINICGGVNMFASAPSLTQAVSEEDLLVADPDAIISSTSLEPAETGLRSRSQRFSQMSAVRNNHIFFVHPDLINRQTVRTLVAAKTVCAQLESVRSGREKEPTRPVPGTG
ncbi:cobalamin-binding protein [Nitrosospira sp. Is2]|uniref:cobalamin-binding protein n=1 Tax=Nitrosospira sp. Is2 TaxID=3080532 RepID=UPI002953AC8E|nr:cobalamin-binding protein [Nitrosospira sp. Is2]WON75361.1 cobalamin-binding protein [Nitrosospira sp. Is2]